MNPVILKGDNGAILIAVVWIVLLLSLLAVAVTTATFGMRQAIQSVEQERRELILAEAAMTVFMKEHFYSPDERAFLADIVAVQGQEYKIQVTFESGKINLNRASRSLLSAMFILLGNDEAVSQAAAAAIVDWRDSDSSTTSDGAEGADYDAAGLHYWPRNGPFESIGELAYVLGIPENAFLCVRPLLTVSAPASAPVNLDHAPQRVKEIIQWAHDQEWEDVAWPNPSLVEGVGDVIEEARELSGEVLKIEVNSIKDPSKRYEALVRYRTTSDRSYAYLKPIGRSLEVSSPADCSLSE